ncbi:MAG: TetR/AcrR family transcriptional regulator [Myxococcota bacterium]|jgi:AcrR family transcriptional regulator|nr:TetR/AcrR family transcriptional regulator [Myxococcota bacterium]
MPRSIPKDRIPQLLEAGTAVFIAQGYRRTQMEDVAHALGVAKGTLYGYVESKEALFHAALLYADAAGPLPKSLELPFPTPPSEATLGLVRARLARDLAAVESLATKSDPTSRNPATELESLIRGLFEHLSKGRRATKLLDACAPDQPELFDVWCGDARAQQLAILARYLERCFESGALRELPDAAVAARLFYETIAFWAIHRHWDALQDLASDEDAEAVVVGVLTRGFLG